MEKYPGMVWVLPRLIILRFFIKDNFYFLRGKNCEIDLGLCFDFSCENGGTCKSIQQKAKCFCPIPYFGLHCEKTGLIEKSVGLKGDGFLQFGKNNYDNIILYFSTEDYNSILMKYEANEIGLDVYSEYKIYCFNSILFFKMYIIYG